MSLKWLDSLIESLKDDIERLSTSSIVIRTRSRTEGILNFESMRDMNDWQLYYIFCFGWDERFTMNSYGKYLDDNQEIPPEELHDILPRNIEERLWASLHLLKRLPDILCDDEWYCDFTDRLFNYCMDVHAYFRKLWIKKRGDVRKDLDFCLWDIFEIISDISKIFISQLSKDKIERLNLYSLINLYALSWENEYLKRIMSSLHRMANPEDFWVSGILVTYIRHYQHTDKVLWYTFQKQGIKAGIAIQEALRKN